MRGTHPEQNTTEEVEVFMLHRWNEMKLLRCVDLGAKYAQTSQY